jgi:uncharacterized membrane protein
MMNIRVVKFLDTMNQILPFTIYPKGILLTNEEKNFIKQCAFIVNYDTNHNNNNIYDNNNINDVDNILLTDTAHNNNNNNNLIAAVDNNNNNNLADNNNTIMMNTEYLFTCFQTVLFAFIELFAVLNYHHTNNDNHPIIIIIMDYNN